AARVRTDLIRADGKGLFELALQRDDHIEDRSRARPTTKPTPSLGARAPRAGAWAPAPSQPRPPLRPRQPPLALGTAATPSSPPAAWGASTSPSTPTWSGGSR